MRNWFLLKGCWFPNIFNPDNFVHFRDFVSIRQHKIEGRLHVVSDISIEHSSKPVSKEYVRGTNGLGGWVVEPDMGNSHNTRLRWFVNSDIKLKVRIIFLSNRNYNLLPQRGAMLLTLKFVFICVIGIFLSNIPA